MANRNAAVAEMLNLSYESDRSVARPGPTDWFQDHIYVPTLLDTRLLPEILEDRYDLVLITGNPGDGKSAFLSRVIGKSTHSGRSILVKHDATEPDDESDRAASALNDLIKFLDPFMAPVGSPSGDVRIVGINKGLLVRAFLGPNAPARHLRDRLLSSMHGEDVDPSFPRLLVVDLNLRSEALIPLDEEGSLFDSLLKKLVAPALWEDLEGGCGTCEDQDSCPFLSNARMARQADVRQRMKVLWTIQQLRSDRHATVRDLLAALSYILVGHHDMYQPEEGDRTSPACAFVERNVATSSVLSMGPRLLYNSCFTQGDIFHGRLDLLDESQPSVSESVAPRVVTEYLHDLDPVFDVSSTTWDDLEESVVAKPGALCRDMLSESAALGAAFEKKLLESYERAFERLEETLTNFEAASSEYAEALDDHSWLTLMLAEQTKRRAFFFADIPLGELTRFVSLPLFLKGLEAFRSDSIDAADALDLILRSLIPRGLIASDDLRPQEDSPEFLEVRWSEKRGDVTGVMLLRLDDATIDHDPKDHPHVETSPERLIYKPFSGAAGRQTIAVGLDAFEGLFRLARGYRPGFVGVPRTRQLSGFRDGLRSRAPARILLTAADDPARQVKVHLDQRIRFE